MRRSLLLVVVLLTVLGFAPAARAGTAVPPALPTAIASAGDSITRGYDVTLWGCVLRDCPSYSWSTGTNGKVTSQYARIEAAQPGVLVTATNVARTGARMADLDGQLRRLVGDGYQYVTVLLGANDVCASSPPAMTSVASFQASYTTALTRFLGRHPSAYVSVSSIPNIYQLWKVFKDSPSARKTWSTFGICQSMLSARNTEQTRLAVLAREQAFNEVLEKGCLARPRCHWDGGALFRVRFARSDVSTVDHFHPSVAGQARLAAVSWAAGYWPKR
jgi:lysophospholipase L1-like esterase